MFVIMCAHMGAHKSTTDADHRRPGLELTLDHIDELFQRYQAETGRL